MNTIILLRQPRPSIGHHIDMSTAHPSPSITPREILSAWGKILTGKAPMLSIEITRECPLSCPGCYAYGDTHLGGGKLLSELNDFRGDALVHGVLELVRKNKPMHVSLVGGEPLVRHRELSAILPALSAMDVFSLVVTSGVIPIPLEWMDLRRVRVAVSVDGLPEHHDIRRKPATYERILKNIDGRKVNIHWVITRPMVQRPGYLEEYVSFWNARTEVDHIWVSLYTPQIGEESAEKLTVEDRQEVARVLPSLARKYPKFLMNEGIAQAFLRPPEETRRLSLREDVRQLFRGFADARRTVRLRRHSQLRRMRMCRQQRTALDPDRQSDWPSARRAFCGWFRWRRLARQPHATRWGKALALAPQRS